MVSYHNQKKELNITHNAVRCKYVQEGYTQLFLKRHMGSWRHMKAVSIAVITDYRRKGGEEGI